MVHLKSILFKIGHDRIGNSGLGMKKQHTLSQCRGNVFNMDHLRPFCLVSYYLLTDFRAKDAACRHLMDLNSDSQSRVYVWRPLDHIHCRSIPIISSVLFPCKFSL